MFEKIRYWWEDLILRQFHKYYQVGCHCSFCGKWVETDIGQRGWAWTICDECQKEYS